MSCDVMEFPRTPEEFCRQYGFFDKDEVYTNGSLLISVFRVEQMVEHYFERTCRNIEKSDYSFTCSECGESIELHNDYGGYDTIDHFNYCPSCGAKVVSE